VIPRPRFSLPLGVAVAIVVGAYCVRSLVIRSGDFALDLPSDAVVIIALAVGIGLVAWARRRARTPSAPDMDHTGDERRD
jgi:hypothetical protein